MAFPNNKLILNISMFVTVTENADGASGLLKTSVLFRYEDDDWNVYSYVTACEPR
jgi:hypothetical protein